MNKIAIALTVLFMSFDSFALNQIIRPYQSVRGAAMGNVILTTGLYDENFFGNPARATANPEWKVDLPNPSFETTADTISALGDLLDASDLDLTTLGEYAGSTLHGRVQMTFPSVYLPYEYDSFAFGFVTSTQFDIAVRNEFIAEPDSITDAGFNFTYARKIPDLAGGDVLSVGITLHWMYRISSREPISFVDIIKGNSISPLITGGDGAHFDFSIGSTYDLPWQVEEFVFSTALTFNHILGGFYENIAIRPLDNGNRPLSQPFTMGLGFSARRPTVGAFRDLILAVEFTDIFASRGSWFKTIHMGAEIWWEIIAMRLGLNQGYPGFGFGFDLTALTFDFAFYGEELSTNLGDLQSRRLAIRIGFQI